MAIKDVEAYYDQVSNDYVELLDTLRDMEKEANEGLVSPDKLEQLKESIEPVKTNYMRISYIMFLLKKPSKFELFLNKLGIHTKGEQYSKRVDTNSTLEAVQKENKDIVKNLTLK